MPGKLEKTAWSGEWSTQNVIEPALLLRRTISVSTEPRVIFLTSQVLFEVFPSMCKDKRSSQSFWTLLLLLWKTTLLTTNGSKKVFLCYFSPYHCQKMSFSPRNSSKLQLLVSFYFIMLLISIDFYLTLTILRISFAQWSGDVASLCSGVWASACERHLFSEQGIKSRKKWWTS